MIELLIELKNHVLDNTNVHTHYIVEYFDADDSQRQDCLWQDHLVDRVRI